MMEMLEPRSGLPSLRSGPRILSGIFFSRAVSILSRPASATRMILETPGPDPTKFSASSSPVESWMRFMSSMLLSGSASDKKAMAKKSTEKTLSFILGMLLACVVVVLSMVLQIALTMTTVLSLYIPTEGATLSQDEVIHTSAFVVFKDNEENLLIKGWWDHKQCWSGLFGETLIKITCHVAIQCIGTQQGGIIRGDVIEKIPVLE